MIKLFVGALALALSLNAQADAVKDNVAVELGFIKRIFETGYAPMGWKKDHFGLDFQAEYNEAMADLASKTDLSAQDYRRIMLNFFRSTRDYHVGVGFYATESASLPFTVNGVDGRYFVVWIETEKVSASTFPVQIGDELITFDGRPVANVVAEIKAENEMGEPTTDWRLAERYLTKRHAAMGFTVPSGPIDLEFKRADGTVIKRQMAWSYTPETIEWKPQPELLRGLNNGTLLGKKPFQIPQMTWGMWDAWQTAEIADQLVTNPYQIGGRESYVPQLGSKIWESQATDTFHAYIYKNDAGKLIGYVRIPHYMGGTEGFNQFKEIVRRFEEVTDGMIIDQINNPGGSVFYVMALMSVLSKDPIKVPDHHITLWPAMVKDMVDSEKTWSAVTNDDEAVKAIGVDQLDGFPVNYQFIQSALQFARLAIANWNAGKKLTPPLHLWGLDRVNPHPEVNYTKPILVLTNELDFSGGDFFPAILQDNQRARIFGQRTSGAGGYVLSVEFPSSMGMQAFSFTGSLARRVDNKPIENLGVTPDIYYNHSINDLTSGYPDYKAAINKAIADML